MFVNVMNPNLTCYQTHGEGEIAAEAPHYSQAVRQDHSCVKARGPTARLNPANPRARTPEGTGEGFTR